MVAGDWAIRSVPTTSGKSSRTHPDLLATLPDKELAAAPAGSRLAEEYYAAMGAAINFAWVNRQLIMHRTREVFADVFDCPWRTMEMELLYDVAHNIAKKETHVVRVGSEGRPVGDGEAVGREERELFVHRKGATRAFRRAIPTFPARISTWGNRLSSPAVWAPEATCSEAASEQWSGVSVRPHTERGG